MLAIVLSGTLVLEIIRGTPVRDYCAQHPNEVFCPPAASPRPTARYVPRPTARYVELGEIRRQLRDSIRHAPSDAHAHFRLARLDVAMALGFAGTMVPVAERDAASSLDGLNVSLMGEDAGKSLERSSRLLQQSLAEYSRAIALAPNEPLFALAHARTMELAPALGTEFDGKSAAAWKEASLAEFRRAIAVSRALGPYVPVDGTTAGRIELTAIEKILAMSIQLSTIIERRDLEARRSELHRMGFRTSAPRAISSIE